MKSQTGAWHAVQFCLCRLVTCLLSPGSFHSCPVRGGFLWGAAGLPLSRLQAGGWSLRMLPQSIPKVQKALPFVSSIFYVTLLVPCN